MVDYMDGVIDTVSWGWDGIGWVDDFVRVG